MKNMEESNFITIESPNTDPGAKQAISIEQLTIDGKESQINHVLEFKAYKTHGDF